MGWSLVCIDLKGCGNGVVTMMQVCQRKASEKICKTLLGNFCTARVEHHSFHLRSRIFLYKRFRTLKMTSVRELMHQEFWSIVLNVRKHDSPDSREAESDTTGTQGLTSFIDIYTQ